MPKTSKMTHSLTLVTNYPIAQSINVVNMIYSHVIHKHFYDFVQRHALYFDRLSLASRKEKKRRKKALLRSVQSSNAIKSHKIDISIKHDKCMRLRVCLIFTLVRCFNFSISHIATYISIHLNKFCSCIASRAHYNVNDIPERCNARCTVCRLKHFHSLYSA